MLKTALHISTALLLLTAVSCQEQLIERRAEGILAVRLESSSKVEIVTKAEGPEVSPDNFNVYVTSDRGTTRYVYDEMEGGVPVISGMYTVAADNVTEDEAISTPNQWGQPRYYGISARKEVPVGYDVTTFSVNCEMVNSAVSVIFDESVTEKFSAYEVVAYTAEGRELTFDSSNTVGTAPAVAYFTPATLNYEFTGTLADGGKVVNSTGTSALAPKTHLKLTFKVEDNSGTIGLNITVDTDYEIVSEFVYVNPDATE